MTPSSESIVIDVYISEKIYILCLPDIEFRSPSFLDYVRWTRFTGHR